MSKRRYKLHNLEGIKSPNFTLSPLELKDVINFPVKRIYFITKPTNAKHTGSHCHKELEYELFVIANGSCTIVVDDGHGLEEINLGINQAIYLPTMIWHHFKNMSDDLIVLALSSTNYDPERKDYCRDYEEFQKLLKTKGLIQR